MKNKKQIIKCDVTNCQFNNDEEYLCNLESIDVSCTCNKNKCKQKIETICDSFKEKK